MLSAETISERSDDRERWKRRVSYIHSELVVPLVSAKWIAASDALSDASEKLTRAGQLLTVARGADTATQNALGPAAATMARSALTAISTHLVTNGIADVLQDQARTIAKQLQASDLPGQDGEALGRCGSGLPDIELDLSLERLRTATKDKAEPQKHLWTDAVAVARRELGKSLTTKPAERRTWFKRANAIVKGSALLAVDGELLMVAGAPVALASPPSAVGVVGSLALGFNDLAVAVNDV